MGETRFRAARHRGETPRGYPLQRRPPVRHLDPHHRGPFVGARRTL